MWGVIMKLTEPQIKELTAQVLSEWKAQGLVEFKIPEGKVVEKIHEVLRKENQRVQDFEKEIHTMLQKLEAQTPSGFDRHKMYLLLKQRLAKEKGIIL
jgi:hypothetical protein